MKILPFVGDCLGATASLSRCLQRSAVGLFLICFLTTAAPTQAQTQDTARSSGGGGSLELLRLRREVEEKTEEIRAERAELSAIVAYRNSVGDAKNVKVIVPAENVEGLEEAKKILGEMVVATGVLDEDPKCELWRDIWRKIPGGDVDFILSVNGSAVPRTNNSTVSKIISDLEQEVSNPTGSEVTLVSEAVNTLNSIIDPSDDNGLRRKRIARENGITWESIRKEIEAAAKEIEAMSKQLTTAVASRQQSQTERISKLTKALDAEIAARQEKVKNLGSEREAKELQAYNASAKQAEINTLLVYAVYGMVIAIVALFLLLRFFPPELARSIVTERTMIELLSMGFLLLTVIILGTGKLIGGETLGALLGTIAGYIFGQKQGERKGAVEERERVVEILREVGGNAPK